MERIAITSERLSIDKTGFTFHHQNRFFRAIEKESQKEILDILDSGLIEKLIEADLFPETGIADIQVEGYELVLEHKMINHITYPFEWSFSMLKDAALCILNVAETCSEFGYGLHDLHNYNVVFEGCHPLFVDLGSIRKGCSFSDKVESFIDYNYLPLRLFSIGEMTVAKRILSDEYPMRFEPWKPYHRSYLSREITKELIAGNAKNKIKSVFNSLGSNYNLKYNHLTPGLLKKRIEEMQKYPSSTTWGEYHSAYQKEGQNELTPRFQRIIELLNELNVSEVLDCGGNQGLLSRLIREKCPKIREVVCIDHDENAIDQFYLSSKNSPFTRQLFPVHSNLLYPIHVNYFQPFVRRMKSELVLALAITHHLILTQEFPLDFILKQIRDLTGKYVFIEFMPLGLWGGGNRPEIPGWYTVEWFRNNFQNYFTLMFEEKLEENRILFAGCLN